jgi:hypothetical protein
VTDIVCHHRSRAVVSAEPTGPASNKPRASGARGRQTRTEVVAPNPRGRLEETPTGANYRRTVGRKCQLAMHEAGHAVAIVSLGGQVRQVSVRRAGNTGGRCWGGDALPARESAIVSIAGPCAQLFVEDEPTDAGRAHVLANADNDSFDFPTAQRLADEHGFSYDEAVDQAALLVLDNWAAIEAVARALRGARRGLISGGKVSEIVASTRSDTAPSR